MNFQVAGSAEQLCDRNLHVPLPFNCLVPGAELGPVHYQRVDVAELAASWHDLRHRPALQLQEADLDHDPCVVSAFENALGLARG